LRPSFGTFAQPPPATDCPQRCFQNAAMPTTHAGMSPGDKRAGFEGASKAIEVYLLVRCQQNVSSGRELLALGACLR
jgi:hypothetical protein